MTSTAHTEEQARQAFWDPALAERHERERKERHRDATAALRRSRAAARVARDLSLALARDLRMRLTSPSPAAPSPSADPPSKFLGAWVQYVGAAPLIADVAAGSYEQHVDVQPQEVILVPFEVASALVARPYWTALSVVPDALVPTGHDGVTGLDLLWTGVTDPWGVRLSDGLPYFDPDVGAATNERWRLYVVAGVPYVSNDVA